MIAAAKGIKTQEINIHLKVKPEWYVEKINPAGQVPTIEHEGKLIRESTIAFGECLAIIGGRKPHFLTLAQFWRVCTGR